MKITVVCIIGFILAPVLSFCQTTDKAASDAFLITRMAGKFHVEPRPVDSKFSADVFKGMLDNVDADRILFTKADIDRLARYTTTLNTEIKQRKTGYLNLFTNIYEHRLKQADSLIDEIGKKPFDFYLQEKFTVAEDTTYPATTAAARIKLYKKIKSDVLDELVDDIPGNFKSFAPTKQKRYIDSIAAIFQKKEIKSFKRRVDAVLKSPKGIAQYVGNIYCETIASCFDPHTEFFPPEEKENFESELGKQPFQFGFKTKADKNGGLIIDKLQPGSPAFKSGQLNKGDKFVGLQPEGGEPVDISDITTHEFYELMQESNHQKVLFTVKKSNGTEVKVLLQKEQVATDEDNKVKSFILKGAATIGYIYLPAFYEDWETGNDGLNGCANDVGREILKLKKENIDGLILDIRYNGGGSVYEATELAGIFVGAGPMAQQKGQDAKIYAIKNTTSGTLYDGPLAVLVNGYSASASEMLAGTLQDYHRAVIIGSATYGKATMQVVFPMDTTVTPENLKDKHTENSLKLTIGKLYRVNGTSAQFSGVQPDIVLPDLLDAYVTKEADAPYALPPSGITPNKYYQPFTPLPVKQLAAAVQKEIDTNKYFNQVKKLVAYTKSQKTGKDISLNLRDALDGAGQDEPGGDGIDDPAETNKFKVQNNQYEAAMIAADSYLKELNEEFGHHIAADPYIGIAYDVLLKLKNP